MAETHGIEIELDGIGHILQDKTLSVPMYQRSYAWEKSHVQSLIDDIEQAIKDNENQYFLGSIIATNSSGGRPEVVDGQQRLATATIILAAIRDYFADRGDDKRAQEINNYLAKSDLLSMEHEPKLRLSDKDHDFYSRRVLSRAPAERAAAQPTRDSHQKIQDAAVLAKKYVEGLASKPNYVQTLVQRVTYIDKKVQVIFVRVPDESNAFAIFETLNDRGLELALSDLLKNYLFSKSGAKLDEVRTQWMSMYALFEANENEHSLVDFIRQHWSSRNGLTRKKDLYAKIKAAVKKADDALRIATDLCTAAKYYQAVVNTESLLWKQYDDTARERMRILNDLGIVSQRPLLLAILAKFKPQEVKKAMKLIVSWTVRFLVVGRLNVTAQEESYTERAKEIFDGTIDNAAKLRKAMTETAPSDIEFKAAFERATVSKGSLARYYLRALEVIESQGTLSELVVSSNTNEVNLEHILPQSPHANWPTVTDEQATAYTHRIGNLALMGSDLNGFAGNLSFNGKKAFYKKSKLKLTKALAKIKDWGPEQIESRQKKLAELALKAWPLTI
jgi:uncharacterized protein with ParB-like and HNH nuclease domain